MLCGVAVLLRSGSATELGHFSWVGMRCRRSRALANFKHPIPLRILDSHFRKKPGLIQSPTQDRMTLSNLLSGLEQKLSPGAEILIDPSSAKFKAVLQRWSDIDVKVPGAILRPTTKSDTVNIVSQLTSPHLTIPEASDQRRRTRTNARQIKAAHEYGIPFVPASGGHSPWSTIDSSGFILDLGLCKSIVVEAETESVRVTGAVLIKELTTALYEAGRCTATGNGNTVGVIPFCLGGGISTLTGMIGFGCDQILSADIVLADGTLVHASADQESDLLWAVKGAGQFFGVVVELRLKTYPLSIFGSPQGTHWMGNLVYPLDRAEEVCKALETVMVTRQHNTAGIIILMAPPPEFKPMIAVSLHFLSGDPALAPQAFQSLLDLNPLMYAPSTPTYPKISDSLDYACAKGDYKRFSLAGASSFNAQNFMKVIEIYKELLAACPDAGATGYAFEWHTGVKELPVADSAFGNENTMLWLNTFSWYHSAENHDLVLDFENRAIAAMRVGTEESEFVDYANCNRIDPIERRYHGKERLERLRMLKKKWDPNGVFTKQLL
ncbi:FAD binding domain containing protein [Rutstroemia sp. NJR-2017a BVV2]|nr:FAD binding domain containing protein [Rutstroemia sp. NJR-2017a BVV2]